jgi:DNA ligase-1
MLARFTRYPFDSPNHIFELKWDGIRALAFVEEGAVRLQSRSLHDITAGFPELARLAKTVKADGVVLDGEIVCFGRDGRPSFATLQKRLQAQSRGSGSRRPRAHFVAFDLLYIDGESVMHEPLSRRKNLLHDVLRPTETAMASDFVECSGKDLFSVTQRHELEGVVAKDKASPYLPGRRGPGWHKIKRVRESDFVVAGYDLGGERRPFTSLLLGLYDERGRLLFVGHVGAGFSRSQTRQLHRALQSQHTNGCPFDNPPRVERFLYWCKPKMVCRVEYGEFTNQGRLRYAMFVSRVDDKAPTDCLTEDAPGWPIDLPVV